MGIGVFWFFFGWLKSQGRVPPLTPLSSLALNGEADETPNKKFFEPNPSNDSEHWRIATAADSCKCFYKVD